MALNKQLPSPFTEIGVGPDQRLPSNLVACWSCTKLWYRPTESTLTTWGGSYLKKIRSRCTASSKRFW
jgi:hypothetical protein